MRKAFEEEPANKTKRKDIKRTKGLRREEREEGKALTKCRRGEVFKGILGTSPEEVDI